jgi:pyruvate kinase
MSGMDVARLNLSHGSHDEHARCYDWVRRAGDETAHAGAVLADLQGPKIRLGTFVGGRVSWAAGDRVVVTTEDVPGTAESGSRRPTPACPATATACSSTTATYSWRS